MRNEQENNTAWKTLKAVFIAIFLGLLFLGSWFTIPAGHRGVLITLGKPSEMAYSEGFHLKIPLIQSVIKMNVQTLKYEADASAASKDLQVVSTKVAVNFHILPEKAVTIYRELSPQYDSNVISPALQEVVKSVTAEFTAEELITKRPLAKDQIVHKLRERLDSRGIIVEDISITNFDFSESFNHAIESKVTAEQLKLKADNDLLRIRVEAEQKIASAGAEAEALRLQRLEITPDLIKLRQIEVQRLAVEKWDGHLPTVTGGALPFIDITNIEGEAKS